MRPRESSGRSRSLYPLTPLPAAYGEYNDQVREVAGMRGQSIVTWDFECVQMLPLSALLLIGLLQWW